MRRRTALLAFAMLVTTGCSSWHMRAAPTAADTASFAHPIRVTRSDQSVLVLDHARVNGDSLVGESDGGRVAIALRDVQRIDERRVSAPRTTALVVGTALAALAALMILAAATLTPNWN